MHHFKEVDAYNSEKMHHICFFNYHNFSEMFLNNC